VTIVNVKKQVLHVLSVCVCILGYPVCKVCAPYYVVICSLSGPSIFYHVSRKMQDFRKRSYWAWNVCFGFPYHFCLKHFSS